jgi:SAM-dependent methyltransferase
MHLDEFYRYQAKARRLTNVADVQALTALNTRLYDSIVLPWLPRNRNARIYEAACGPGIFLNWLRLRGYDNLAGSDFSDVQIALAQGAGFEVRLADSITELGNLASDSLDCVVALDFYEHLPKEALMDFLHVSRRVLRSGGTLILRGPNGDSPVVGRALYNDITHITTYTSVAFTVLLEMAGFSTVQFRDDALASIAKRRWLYVPASWVAQRVLRLLLRLATRENIQCTSASFFLCAWKA